MENEKGPLVWSAGVFSFHAPRISTRSHAPRGNGALDAPRPVVERAPRGAGVKEFTSLVFVGEKHPGKGRCHPDGDFSGCFALLLPTRVVIMHNHVWSCQGKARVK